MLAAGVGPRAVQTFIEEIASLAEPVTPYYRWRPQLADPGDEMALEAAVSGQADAIVTFNVSHLRGAHRFGVAVRTPSEMLRWMHHDGSI